MTDGETRDRALIRWEVAAYPRDAQPHEDHLLPLMVATGAASGVPGAVHFRGALGKPISDFRFGCPQLPRRNFMTKLLVVETSPRAFVARLQPEIQQAAAA